MKSLLLPSQCVILFLTIFSSQLISSFSDTSKPKCHPNESLALLKLKAELPTNPTPPCSPIDMKGVRYIITSNWSDSMNCCNWEGVTCDYVSGHVIGLDLYCGGVRGFITSNSSLFALTHLQSLDLSYNEFQGSSIVPEFGGFKNMTDLRLDDSNFYGDVPLEISHLSKLASLRIGGEIRVTGATFKALVHNLPRLRELVLEGINLSSIPSVYFSNFSSLTTLSLWDCNLHGEILENIFHLSKLQVLDLSYNPELTGHFPTSINYTFPNLLSLALSACNLTEFPNFLISLKPLLTLDLSSNKIQGRVPKWLWDMGKESLHHLNLSHNSLTFMDPLPWSNLRTLDLHHNLISGPVPISSAPLLKVLLGSKNKFEGEISTSFCNMTFLKVLDLSNNTLTGKIPPCFSNFSPYLSVLDLRRNRLHGNIPTAFSKRNSLRNLNLNGNQLEGALPRSLLNCTNLEVLDVGNNFLNGIFPDWIESLPQLRVLVLRFNMFHGSIENPKTEFPFKGLRIMDLSNNKFSGPLPTKLFENFEAMTNAESVKMEYMGEFYYQDSVMMTMKGNDIELVKIQTILTTIDFSCNNFTGEIPSLIGRLKSLKGLNFSHNTLSGKIPSTFGNLSNLEWLDLSSNQLAGEIPPELVRMTWISFLNLSRNQLVGPIPRGSQFNTFCKESFGGNLDLCGLPLSKLCGDDMDVKPNSDLEDEDSDDSNWFEWKIAWMGYACGVVIGVSSGYILLYSNGKLSWLSESVLVELAILTRKFQASVRKPKKRDQKKKSGVDSLGR